ncbi:MAG TPA: preprotein translocase subunit SecE [Actinomycetota bacterium]
MNRQTKRLMARQEAAKQRAPGTAAPRRPPTQQERKKRVPPRQFLKEVRQELKKVNWPTRKELGAYFVVVLVSVVVLTSFVFGLDYGFSKAVLKIFAGG